MSKAVLITILVLVLVLVVFVVLYLMGGLNNSSNFKIQGMSVQVTQKGNGQEVKEGDSVTTNYIGWFQDGKQFDSSYDRHMPFTFTVGKGNVIKGWDLGVVGMKVGEKRKLIIPPELAYGEKGIPGIIPANATLTFQIEVMQINNGAGTTNSK